MIEVGRAIASLLAATHDAGLVHRDVKPANVFVEGPLAALQRCRLGDFGLAFMLQPETATMGRLTLDAVMVGTPFYMAPEQAAAGEVGVAADVYSLGCMLHELATGRPPFVGNLARIIAGHMYLPPVPLCELDPDMPQALEQLVLAMLAKVPAERPTAREVVERLALASASSAPVRPRGAWQPRGARSVGTGTLGERTLDEPRDDDEALVIAVEADAPDLVTELRAHGVAIDGAAPIVVVSFGSLAEDRTGDPRGRIALHPSPTANDLAHAIRHGADGIVRWPGPLAPILQQIQRATQHRRRGRAR